MSMPVSFGCTVSGPMVAGVVVQMALYLSGICFDDTGVIEYYW